MGDGSAIFNSSTLGAANDRVTIELGLAPNNTIVICTFYEITRGIFDPPNEFSIRLGSGDVVRKLIQQYPKGSPFRLKVGGQTQFTGYTDGFEGDDNGHATELSFTGRDILAAIHDTEIEKEESFNADTHRALCEKAIARVNLLKPFEADRPSIIGSNAASRVQNTGQNIIAAEDSSEAQLLQIAGSAGDAYTVLRTHVGETLLNLLKRHLDAVGLFPWAAASGDIVVGVPNSKQPPLYKLVRRRGGAPTSNVIGARLRDSNKQRYSEVVIVGKTTGHKYSKSTLKGTYTDDEVINSGVTKIRVLRNMDVTSIAHAEHLAKKELAACRRAGFFFEYTVAGHSAPSLLTNGKTRAVFAPDTVVAVDDDEYGLHGNFWIESVVYRRQPHTTTTIRMLSPDTLIFGDQAFPTPQ